MEVIAGDDKGERGKVLKVDRQVGKLIVEGVNRVYKHVRRSQRNPQGGRLSKEMPVQISNVLLVCPKCSKADADRRPARVQWHKGTVLQEVRQRGSASWPRPGSPKPRQRESSSLPRGNWATP